jgi:hypothetical protein
MRQTFDIKYIYIMVHYSQLIDHANRGSPNQHRGGDENKTVIIKSCCYFRS